MLSPHASIFRWSRGRLSHNRSNKSRLPGTRGVGVGIYDAASLTLDGPTGGQVRGEDLKRARDVVRQKFGER